LRTLSQQSAGIHCFFLCKQKQNKDGFSVIQQEKKNSQSKISASLPPQKEATSKKNIRSPPKKVEARKKKQYIIFIPQFKRSYLPKLNGRHRPIGRTMTP
jgi:hypothetical protein